MPVPPSLCVSNPAETVSNPADRVSPPQKEDTLISSTRLDSPLFSLLRLLRDRLLRDDENVSNLYGFCLHDDDDENNGDTNLKKLGHQKPFVVTCNVAVM